MPVFYPTSSFFESSGNLASQFPEAVRDGIVDFSCSIWSNFPAFISNNKSPGASFARGYMNSICNGRVPLPSLPPPPFTGGQCPGVAYNFEYRRASYNIGTCVLNQDQTLTIQLTGPIGDPFHDPTGVVGTSSCNGLNNDPVELGNWLIPTGTGNVNIFSSAFNDPSGVANPPISFIEVISVTRVDGLPDNCGDPPSLYPPDQPTGNDLTTIIVVPVPGDIDLEFNLTYNQLSPTFNFPIGFKLNGVNVTLDFSGLTIHGDTSYNTFNFGNLPDPSGSDGGDNGVDGPYTEEYPDFNYPTLPEITNPEIKDSDIEYAVCNDGVITIVQAVIGLIPGQSAWINLALQVLSALVADVCEIENEAPLIGFPEYYGVKPGATRPAIVYLYKEWNGETYGASTYSSTVNQPSSSAVAEIPTVSIPDKTIGQFVASITLIGGTRLRASGISNPAAIANLEFLIGKVDPSILPNNYMQQIVVTEDTRLNTTALVCRQIEYYPTGAGANKSPTIRRVIDQ